MDLPTFSKIKLALNLSGRPLIKNGDGTYRVGGASGGKIYTEAELLKLAHDNGWLKESDPR